MPQIIRPRYRVVKLGFDCLDLVVIGMGADHTRSETGLSGFRFKPGVAVVRLDDNAILIDTQTQSVYALNRIAYEMVRIMTTVDDELEVQARLHDIIEVDSSVLQHELSDLRATLAELNLAAVELQPVAA